MKLPDTKTLNLFVDRYYHATLLNWPFEEKPEFEIEYIVEYMALSLRALQRVLIQRECMAEYPENWIEALKDRFAPMWVLRRWPVRKTRIDMEVLYPRIGILDQPCAVQLKIRTPDDYLRPYSN